RQLLEAERTSSINPENIDISTPPDLLLTFRIGFDEAEKFRKANGGYLRRKQWEDLIVEVVI
ncbi:MAG: hypothetical protein PHV07_09300, partial [Oscillospiraceae bacterium]|nr:hypothetical protein [Oscillospiraceae bacterium]